MVGGNTVNAAAVPTLLGTGSFSLLSSDQDQTNNELKPPGHLRWPHMLVDQVRGLGLREIGGGFAKHHRAPSIRAACYAIAKPSTMVQKMQNFKKVRGHRNAVYCAIFDRSGRYVITGSDDRLVKIWSMETAYCLASCRGHEGDITDLAVNSNNTLVASASNDCIIRVWRLADGLPISVLRGHTGAVTAIAFNPRPSSIYQLLSSSDDGTCRIWDSRYSQFTPRLYIPKAPETVAGKNTFPSSSTVLQSHQIFCCAFNASGTFFVTGSSDTCARVWNACKSNSDDSEQPNHEIEILSGHENDVNYVQFSGCAVASRFSPSDASKEDSVPKFKNSWFNHDNIVTCSRDGSAIIWIPRSRRSHGKGGRWQKAYHLKVPPPPMPPQPPRGGPRQRILPTPRGVNMIVWSLDNRFVLAAIMDCRICVWNAVDGSLVHSLTGHTESTYVLDVHPFNPRIAMSAGYDGKTIVWDIWEGAPIRTYEIGRFKLVDGKFSPDGTSIILSDDVGQLYILNTGQGESQKDAKYDQFFLGDYRPLVQDTHGNVLDQETQLAPYRRNMQDLLCDAGMIPYPEPYQSMYQQRRLGALGIEWRPSSFRFSIGTDFNMDQQYQTFPIVDLEMLMEPLPGFVDAMDWEPEIEIQSDESDSEYNVTEELSSGKDQGSFCSDASANPEFTDEDSEAEGDQKDALRRSRRKKQKAEVEVMTSSGRRVKRKNLDECDNSSHRINRTRKSRHGRKAKKKSSSKSLRPQRAAARNALHLFSRITGTFTEGEDEYGSEGDSSESESTLKDSNDGNEDSDVSLNSEQHGHSKGKEICFDHSDETNKLQPFPSSNLNGGIRRRLVLKLPNRDSSKYGPPKNYEAGLAGPSLAPEEAAEASQNYFGCQDNNLSDASGDIIEKNEIDQPTKTENHLDLLVGCKDGNIRWGGVKSRSAKRSRMGELLPSSSVTGPSSFNEAIQEENVVNGHSMLEKDHHRVSPCSGIRNEINGIIHGNDSRCQDAIHEAEYVKLFDETDCNHPFKENATPVPMRLRIRSKILSSHLDKCGKTDAKTSLEDAGCTACDTFSEPQDTEKVLSSEAPTQEDRNLPTLYDGDREKRLDADNVGGTSVTELQDSQNVRSHDMMFRAVYRRSKFGRGRSGRESLSGNMEATTSNVGSHSLAEVSEAIVEGVRRTRSITLRSATCDLNPAQSNDRFMQPHDGSEGTSMEKTSGNRDNESSYEERLLGSAVAAGLRSTRTRRGSYYAREPSPPERRKSNQAARSSWLTLVAHEEGSRYIPQRGDEIVYLRQGHEEYITQNNLRDLGPWKTIKENIRAVEFCMVENLEYTTRPGSGESCAKIKLKFVDPASAVVGKSFQLTLPEVTGFPDFLVERSRYDAAIERNWTSRDKCQVWWKNEGDEDGSWWEGRILNVQAKSHEYPDSPWERYIVRYKSDPSETHQHSPWELYDADTQWEQPRLDDETREKLMRAFTKLEQSGNKAQDYYGVEKLRQVSQKSNFINRFPVPLSLEIIWARLENNYYRSLEGMKHDIEVMLSNAESYFGRNAELTMKVRRLSEWFRRTLSSL
uniref:PH-interacting protein n=1 Tax=Nicotiana tabacum TaxID=4097 RepID=A0A1S4BJK4_TOBAC|nr:PREDICTED: PH-interacting protein-like [Nicotiana tabacum]